MQNQVITKAKSGVKSSDNRQAAAGNVVAQTHYQRELIERFFTCCQNNLVPSQSIERYCYNNNIDLTLIGVTDGEFYSTVSRQHKSFKELQKIGVLNHKEKDTFTNHIVIPILDGADIIGLKFADLSNIQVDEPEKAKPVIELIDKQAFSVRIKNRQYIIKNLVQDSHQLKAVVKLISGTSKHVDVVNFYSAGNRKRLISDICESLFFPFAEIRDDISQLLDICEEGIQQQTISENAHSLLKVIKDDCPKEFTISDLVDLTSWQRMTIHRALDELCQSEQIIKTSAKRPQQYRLSSEIT